MLAKYAPTELTLAVWLRIHWSEASGVRRKIEHRTSKRGFRRRSPLRERLGWREASPGGDITGMFFCIASELPHGSARPGGVPPAQIVEKSGLRGRFQPKITCHGGEAISTKCTRLRTSRRELSRLPWADIVLPDLVKQRLVTDVQLGGRPFAIPRGFFQHLGNHFHFGAIL